MLVRFGIVPHHVDIGDLVAHLEGFPQLRGHPATLQLSFRVRVGAVSLVLGLCTSSAQGKVELPVAKVGQDRMIEALRRDHSAPDQSKVGEVLGCDGGEVFADDGRMSHRIFGVLHAPGIEADHILVGQVLVLLALRQKSGGVSPATSEGLSGVHGLGDIRLGEELLHLCIVDQLLVQFVFPHLHDMDTGAPDLADAGQRAFIGVLDSFGAPWNPQGSVGVAAGASMPDTAMELIDSLIDLVPSIHLVLADLPLTFISGVLYLEVFRLGDPHQPLKGLDALVFLPVVASWWYNADRAPLQVVLLEFVHAGRGDGDGDVENPEPSDLEEQVLEFEAASGQDLGVALAVFESKMSNSFPRCFAYQAWNS